MEELGKAGALKVAERPFSPRAEEVAEGEMARWRWELEITTFNR